MVKAVIGLLVTILVTSIAGVALGFVYIYEHLGLTWLLTFLGIYVGVIVSCGVTVYFLLGKIKVEVEKLVSSIKNFVQKLKELSVKDIIKIVIKLLGK